MSELKRRSSDAWTIGRDLRAGNANALGVDIVSCPESTDRRGPPISPLSGLIELSSRNRRRKLPLFTHYIAAPPDGFNVVLAA